MIYELLSCFWKCIFRFVFTGFLVVVPQLSYAAENIFEYGEGEYREYFELNKENKAWFADLLVDLSVNELCRGKIKGQCDYVFQPLYKDEYSISFHYPYVPKHKAITDKAIKNLEIIYVNRLKKLSSYHVFDRPIRFTIIEPNINTDINIFLNIYIVEEKMQPTDTAPCHVELQYEDDKIVGANFQLAYFAYTNYTGGYCQDKIINKFVGLPDLRWLPSLYERNKAVFSDYDIIEQFIFGFYSQLRQAPTTKFPPLYILRKATRYTDKIFTLHKGE